jgi:glycosyltransferase involved in cell wall biosynthesis
MVGPSLSRDGAPLSQLELARGLSSAGVSVEALSPTDGPLRATYEASGIKLSLCEELTCSPVVPSWYEADVARLAELLDRQRPDALFVNTIDCFPAVDAAALAGIPAIWNIRESEPWRERLADRHPAIAARALASLAYCDALVFVADSSRNTWSQFISPHRTHLIHNAAHPSVVSGVPSTDERHDIRAALGARPDDVLVVSIGTLCPRKGQVDLARALSLLPTHLLSRLRTAFIGRADLDYPATIESALAAAPTAHVRFLGETKDAARYAAAADILVNTSRSEAFPRTFIEAAAGRTAIVAANIDGAAERLRHGVSAMLYTPGDIPDLAAKLEAASDAAVRARLADGAHAALIADWTYDQMIAAYKQLVGGALRRRPSFI